MILQPGAYFVPSKVNLPAGDLRILEGDLATGEFRTEEADRAAGEVRAGERDLTAGESCFEKPTSPPVNSAPKK